MILHHFCLMYVENLLASGSNKEKLLIRHVQIMMRRQNDFKFIVLLISIKLEIKRNKLPNIIPTREKQDGSPNNQLQPFYSNVKK